MKACIRDSLLANVLTEAVILCIMNDYLTVNDIVYYSNTTYMFMTQTGP